MKSLIIVYSYHHNNTYKIAQTMAQAINAELMSTEQAKNINLDEYDLVGFGAGIDSGMHYKELLDFAIDINSHKESKNCFVFSTAGVCNPKKMIKDHSQLNEILIDKGYNNLGDFSCLGFNTNSIIKHFGGINKEHPNNEDINNALRFASSLLSQ